MSLLPIRCLFRAQMFVLCCTLLFTQSGCEPVHESRTHDKAEYKIPFLEVQHRGITWRRYEHDQSLQPMCPKCGVEGYIEYPDDDAIKCSFGCQACDWSSQEFMIDGDVLMELIHVKTDQCGIGGFE